MAALAGLNKTSVYSIYAYPGFRGHIEENKYADPVTYEDLPKVDVVIVDCCKRIFGRSTIERILRSPSEQQRRCPSCRTPFNERIIEKSDYKKESSIGELQQKIFDLTFKLNASNEKQKHLISAREDQLSIQVKKRKDAEIIPKLEHLNTVLTSINSFGNSKSMTSETVKKSLIKIANKLINITDNLYEENTKQIYQDLFSRVLSNLQSLLDTSQEQNKSLASFVTEQNKQLQQARETLNKANEKLKNSKNSYFSRCLTVAKKAFVSLSKSDTAYFTLISSAFLASSYGYNTLESFSLIDRIKILGIINLVGFSIKDFVLEKNNKKGLKKLLLSGFIIAAPYVSACRNMFFKNNNYKS
jgi:hypothetical protein